jgi:hypothetical protein
VTHTRCVRSVVIGFLLLGSLLALAIAVLTLAVDGGTCSSHEAGSGCGLKFALAIAWMFAVGFAGAIVLMVRQR